MGAGQSVAEEGAACLTCRSDNHRQFGWGHPSTVYTFSVLRIHPTVFTCTVRFDSANGRPFVSSLLVLRTVEWGERSTRNPTVPMVSVRRPWSIFHGLCFFSASFAGRGSVSSSWCFLELMFWSYLFCALGQTWVVSRFILDLSKGEISLPCRKECACTFTTP